MSAVRDVQWPGVPAPVLQGYGQNAPEWGQWFLYFGIGAALGGYMFNNRVMTVVGIGSGGYGAYRVAKEWRLW
ncbi:MAG: hypothetical protein ACYTGE_11210 [Planctomycetota bacterium]|jgi:hypothetical protein